MATISDTAKRDSLLAFFGAAACLWLAWKHQLPLAAGGTLLFLVQGILLRMNHRAGAAMAVMIAATLPLVLVWLIVARGFNWWRGGLLLLSPLGIWAYWSSYGALLRGKAGWDDPEDEDERRETAAGGPDKPMISIVLLRRSPKFLDPAILLEAVRDAWDESRSLG